MHDQQLKLDFDPFDSTVVEDSFFGGAHRQEVLEELLELCAYSSELAIVTGALGSGKSVLAAELASNLDSNFVVVRVSATLFMSAEQLLEAICAELGLEPASDATTDALLDQLDQYAESLRSRSKTLQILVDDAHELGEEALQSLFKLHKGQADSSQLGDDGIKLIFFGEPMLFNSIEQLAGTAHARFELEPLEGDEVADYIASKLAGAGYHGKLPLDADDIHVIETRAQGIPGAINALVKEQLRGLITQRKSGFDWGFVERHLVAASVLFGALLLALFFTLGSPDDDSQSTVAQGGDTQALPQDGTESQRVQIPLDLSGSISRGTAPSSGITRSPGDAEQAIDSGQATEPAGVTKAASEANRTDDQVSTPPTESGATVATTDGRAGQSESESRSTADRAAQELAVITDRQYERAGELELLGRSPDSYTLQLLGSHSESNVQNFIASHAASVQLHYFETSHEGRPWYVVVHGDFSNRNAAQAAIGRLPATLRELNPWARNLSGIQADIRMQQ